MQTSLRKIRENRTGKRSEWLWKRISNDWVIKMEDYWEE